MKKEIPSNSTKVAKTKRRKLIDSLQQKYSMKSSVLEFFSNDELIRAIEMKKRPDEYLHAIHFSRIVN